MYCEFFFKEFIYANRIKTFLKKNLYRTILNDLLWKEFSNLFTPIGLGL